MTNKYRLTHYRKDGTETAYCSSDLCVWENNDFAVHNAIEKAKELATDGLSGKLVCTGHWGADGFELVIPLDKIELIVDPLAEMPEDESLPGYEKLLKVAAFIWPPDGEQLEPFTINFKILDDCIEVAFCRPCNVLVEMKRGDRKVDAYHGGPSLRLMMIRLNLTETQARKAWDEVVSKLCLLKAQHEE